MHSKKQELESKLILSEKWCKAYEFTITKLSGRENAIAIKNEIKQKIIKLEKDRFPKNNEPRTSFIERQSFEDALRNSNIISFLDS